MNYRDDILCVVRLARQILLVSIPILFLLGMYVWLDPMKVVHHYDSYYAPHNHGGVSLNAAHVALANYENRCDTMHYDSFIMGNSRSIYYETEQWLRYLPAGSVPYHLNASGETLGGIERKLAYLAGRMQAVRNLIIVLDESVLKACTPTDNSHVFIEPPQLGGPITAVKFHIRHFATFLNWRFMRAAIEFSRTGVLKDYMLRDHLLEAEVFDYNPRYNEQTYNYYEQQIADGVFYNSHRMSLFQGKQRPGSVSPAVIGEEQLNLLNSIKKLLNAWNTQCKVVVSPLYDQVKLNPTDLNVLRTVFGSHNVYDFSGVNAITSDYRNYYESSHYRHAVARQIMLEIYSQNK